MKHEERVEACREVSAKLLNAYPEDIIATAVFGSVARGEDREFSDIDMQVLAKEGAKLSSHFFIMRDRFFSVMVKTIDGWTTELTRSESGLCLTAGAFKNILTLHDPTGAFDHLRRVAETLPDESWKNAVRDGIAGLFEDLGRVRNFYRSGDQTNFRLFSVLVAIGEAKVYGDLQRCFLETEREFNRVFEKAGGHDCQAAKAYRAAARLVECSDQDTMDALEWLNEFLIGEAQKQAAMPVSIESALNYKPQ